ncbi:MAG TPA: hypothetical protein VHS58_23635 [Acetobacteraceae bacterium]|jgi:hypothetical protein|nr:hypothetical protein [Acetobacteraceae bacterium]
MKLARIMSNWPAPGWIVHDVAPEFGLRVVREMPPLAAALDRAVDDLWTAALRRTGGALFNGRVFSADAVAPDLAVGHWTEFRRIVAQMDRPDLFDDLRLRPVAVNGITTGPDGVVLGRRPDRAVYQAGLWQCPPAGSVDAGAARGNGAVDIPRQVLTELREELGIAASDARIGRSLALVEHGDSHVLDLGIVVETALSAVEIRRLHAGAKDKEYASVRIVPPAALSGFVRENGAALVPQALVFLARMGWLPEGH